ncbi:Histamine H2 receptor [Dissostichus eleginoides]|uniref:Histamine H2 receptor n=1 Tax=Dissostichus eleginoides TaxID=100907 RepID=A0AAD9ERS9_DISEL|nr:Histamine H2 receptor [Dissostichus eleginoides]
MVFSCVASVSGNLLLLLLLLLHKNLRSDTLILTLSCCFSDITLSLSAFPLAVYHAVSHPPGPPPSDGVLCQGGGFLLLLLQTSSLYSLFWTSVDTFVDICFALIYSMIVTPGRCRLVLLMMWSGCLGAAALPLMGFGHYTYREERYLCGPDFSPAHTAFVMLWLVGVFVPLIAMVSLYGHVVIVARKQARRGTFICNEINCHYVPANIYLRMCVLVCWLPYMTVCVYETFSGHQSPSVISALSTWLVLSSTALNPWITCLTQR